MKGHSDGEEGEKTGRENPGRFFEIADDFAATDDRRDGSIT